MRIVIPGGSGQIGRILARHFFEQGHSVTVIARNPKPAPWRTVRWNGYGLGDWAVEIDGADVVINLAGRSVNCRYTERHRREILDSRVYATRVVGLAIQQALRPPPLWMNAATATIYRHSLDRDMDETGEIGGGEPGAPSSWRFSIDVATAWEEAFFESRTPPETRRVALRSAMVMSPDRGGVFDVLLRLVRLGLGGAAASGRQYVSWIHDSDFVRAIDMLIERQEFSGRDQYLVALSAAESRVHAHAAGGRGDADRAAGGAVDAGNRRGRPAERDGVAVEITAGGPGAAAGCRVCV